MSVSGHSRRIRCSAGRFTQNTFPKDLIYIPGTRQYRSACQERSLPPSITTNRIGYEWTSNTGGNDLYRNVIFRDNADKASQVEPFTVFPPYGSDAR